MKKQVVHVLVVTDDDAAAQCMVRLMHHSWKQHGSGHANRGLTVGWTIGEGALDEFALPGTDADKPYSHPAVIGSLETPDKKEMKGRLGLIIDAGSPGIRIFRGGSRVEFDVQIRLVPAHFFAEHGPAPDRVVDLLMRRDSENDPEPTDFVLLGVTDASLERRSRAAIGSGVDQILSPGLLGRIAATLPVEPRVGVAITGLERDFASFDASDPRWSRYGSAREAAWDPHLIRFMLQQVLTERFHLRTLMQNDEGFRPSRERPIVVTAVMPCGFLRDWNCVNYNAFEPGWIEGSPAIRGERDAPYFEPYCCADPLLTALTGIRTEFQITPEEFRRALAVPRRRRAGWR